MLNEESFETRLARFEEKLDNMAKLLTAYIECDGKKEERLRKLETNVAVLMTVGGGAWVVILLLLGRVFAKII